MIPLQLILAGFLSYREPAELDFTRFALACISGPNGAGKSTLLDAMTWSLFGQARRRDEALINLQSEAAEVTFRFEYEGVEYRVQRTLRRGRSAVMELHARLPSIEADSNGARGASTGTMDGPWRVLTERTLRDTQARLQQILRLDYETFVNASFFLQGKADQFAQQSPTKRKEILTNILGLGAWEGYRMRAADRRRSLEEDLAGMEGRLGEITAELAQETTRREQLAALEADLARIGAARAAQAAALDNLRKTRANLEKQQLLIDGMEAAAARAQEELNVLERRLSEKRATRADQASLMLRENEIRKQYTAWRAALDELHRWDGAALSFHDRSKNRAVLVGEINTEQARLQEEHRQLLMRQDRVQEQVKSAQDLQAEIESERAALAEVERRGVQKTRLLEDLATARETVASLRAENEALKGRMDQLANRIKTLESSSGASCPLCGQPLSDAHRRSTLTSLQQEGEQCGASYRANRRRVEEAEAQIAEMQNALGALADIDDQRVNRVKVVTKLSENLSSLRSAAEDWEQSGRPRLQILGEQLQTRRFAHSQQEELALLDAELAGLGYDAIAHDVCRRAEEALRTADEEHRRLELARAALAPLEEELQSLEVEFAERTAQVERQASELSRLKAELAEVATDLPDAAEAESRLFETQEQENLINQQVGAARQRVNVLGDLRSRRTELEAARQDVALDIGRHKLLERAFGRDGVPALLIEQALPEVETRANEILDRLSDGQMSIRFRTQAGYKDKKRADLRETLDIQISDGAGSRDYEMYSGGEAFRVNFAIRLALSQVLAARNGARLQTLVIDEGFASQDAQGRQRLIEAINLVKDDFAKVLLITHLDELKDAFPARIEVEKTAHGSVVHVA